MESRTMFATIMNKTTRIQGRNIFLSQLRKLAHFDSANKIESNIDVTSAQYEVRKFIII